MSDHFTRTRKAIIKTDHNKSWEEKLEPSHTAGRWSERTGVWPLRKSSGHSPGRLNTELPEDSAVLLLGVCPREMKRMSTVFVIARK